MATKRVGEATFNKLEKINAELFSITYGSIIAQLLQDYDDNVEEVNVQLEKMGYNIGVRLVDEFLAKSQLGRCRGLRETADIVAQAGFKMFLGVSARIMNWSQDESEFSVILPEDNPLQDFVELPEEYAGLYYCNILAGVIRGALEMVQMKVECSFVKCVLKGDEVSEIRVKFLEYLQDEVPVGDE